MMPLWNRGDEPCVPPNPRNRSPRPSLGKRLRQRGGGAARTGAITYGPPDLWVVERFNEAIAETAHSLDWVCLTFLDKRLAQLTDVRVNNALVDRGWSPNRFQELSPRKDSARRLH